MDSNKPNYQIINKINFQIISEKSLDQVITSSDKTLHYTDWLEYYFNMDEDVIDIIKQDERIKAIIALQAIYYLNIFKKLFLSKLMGSKKVRNINRYNQLILK